MHYIFKRRRTYITRQYIARLTADKLSAPDAAGFVLIVELMIPEGNGKCEWGWGVQLCRYNGQTDMRHASGCLVLHHTGFSSRTFPFEYLMVVCHALIVLLAAATCALVAPSFCFLSLLARRKRRYWLHGRVCLLIIQRKKWLQCKSL